MSAVVVPFGSYSADAEATDEGVLVTLWVSTDPGPMKQFRVALQAELDDAHATELLGHLSIALRKRREVSAA